MLFENIRYALAPLAVQLGAAYMLEKVFGVNHVATAFLGSLLFGLLPIYVIGLWFRLSGHADALFMETWFNCALIIQFVFFYRVEMGRVFAPYELAACLAIFLNEVTQYGGGWFGHHIVTITGLFLVLKTFGGVLETMHAPHAQKVWPHS